MKKTILALCIFFLSGNAFAQSKSLPLTITHLKNGLYVYVSYGLYNDQAYPANGMYMVTKKGVVLFDTPWGAEYYEPLLDSIWKRHHQKVVMCISTHFHTDRTGGLGYYRSKGIATYTTRLTDSLCIVHNEHRAQFFIAADTALDIAGNRFELYYAGPGHTIDNIEVFLPKEKVLYGGCFIKSVQDKTLGNLSDADVHDWGKSLRRLQQKFSNPEYVIPGHNDWHDPNSVMHTLDMVTAYNKEHK